MPHICIHFIHLRFSIDGDDRRSPRTHACLLSASWKKGVTLALLEVTGTTNSIGSVHAMRCFSVCIGAETGFTISAKWLNASRSRHTYYIYGVQCTCFCWCMLNTRSNYFGVEPNWCDSLAFSLLENSSVYSHEKGYSFGDNYFINKRIRAWLNECRKPRWQTQNDLTKCQYITVKNGFYLNGMNARWHNINVYKLQ